MPIPHFSGLLNNNGQAIDIVIRHEIGRGGDFLIAALDLLPSAGAVNKLTQAFYIQNRFCPNIFQITLWNT